MGKEIFSQCRLTVSEEIKSKDIITLFQAVRKIGFKISQTSSLIIEKDSTSGEELSKLVNLLTSFDKSQECSYNTTITGAGSETCNKSRRQENGGAKPENLNVLRSLHDRYPYDSRNRKDDTRRSSALDRSTSEERDVDQGVYTGHYSDMRVKIHKADITRLDVDCIVNAANTKLRHGGGVARVIATTAGKELQKACDRFIAAGNTVPVTGVFVSPGGRLPAKNVLHAVGPIWDKYTDKKKCTDDLRRTVLTCLVEAMRLHSSSIALPSISAAIFKVPKELCALNYMEAVRSFDAIFGHDKDCTLKEIHFVDVDDVMVNHIQETFMKHWGEACDSAMIRMDERYFQDYLSSKRPLPPRSGTPSASQNPWKPASQGLYHTERPVCYSAPQAKQSGAGSKTLEIEILETEYQIGRIRLCISSKPALSFDTDPILTIGEEFDKLSGTEHFTIKPNLEECKDHHSQRNVFEFTYLCKPDGKQLRLLGRLYPDPKSPDDIYSAVDKLDAALRMSSLKGTVQRNVTTFVLTSRILYAEPNNTKQEPSKSIVPKLVASLGLNVCEYLYAASQDRSSSLNRVVITASKDAIPYLCEAFESCDIVNKVPISTVV